MFCQTWPMEFQVVVADRPRRVGLVFGNERDAMQVNRWRAPASVREKTAVRDSLEFARLASNRWRYYRRSIPTATNLAEFRAAIATSPQAEVSFILLAKADWFQSSSALGLAQCRRTYCHNLILEFLEVHPLVVGKTAPVIEGVGSGILFGLAEMAGRLGIGSIWGEATAHSAPFYAKAIGVGQIDDQFSMRGGALEHCRRKFRENFLGTLLED
ncbi:MAG: hypothetical protein C5B50_14275 [Verrucomicrobia bacterium]|nr:MAG: hypothetical protein C5B50_14275 [Verrucomicrobiota bacterium]